MQWGALAAAKLDGTFSRSCIELMCAYHKLVQPQAREDTLGRSHIRHDAYNHIACCLRGINKHYETVEEAAEALHCLRCYARQLQCVDASGDARARSRN